MNYSQLWDSMNEGLVEEEFCLKRTNGSCLYLFLSHDRST